MDHIQYYKQFFENHFNVSEPLSVESLEQSLVDILPETILHPMLRNTVVMTHTFYNDVLNEQEIFPFIFEYRGDLIAVGHLHGYQQYIHYLNYLDSFCDYFTVKEDYGEYLD